MQSITTGNRITDAALTPPPVCFDPGPDYASGTRNWQGIPAIERTRAGRLYATWYSGGHGEDNDNHVLLVTSDDDGQTWTDQPRIVVDPPGMTRAWDPCLWHDPHGRLWWYWTMSCPMAAHVWDGRGGVWAMVTENPDDPNPTWSEPKRFAEGVALNKPIVTSDGTWLMPTAVWYWEGMDQFGVLRHMMKPGVVASTDAGDTWQWRGGAEMEEKYFREPMIVELRDGTLWMLVRMRDGISETFSMDGGISWSRGRPSRFAGPNSRFFISRLASGRLLLVNHLGNPDRERSHLTAMLSEDDGTTWPHRLLLDNRAKVSYPDAVEGPDGWIRIVYDFNRFDEREILMARIREEDILAGECCTPDARLRMVINKV